MPRTPSSVREPQKQLTVERVGNVVLFRLRLPDDYTAMALYDEATAALETTGTLSLSVTVPSVRQGG